MPPFCQVNCVSNNNLIHFCFLIVAAMPNAGLLVFHPDLQHCTPTSICFANGAMIQSKLCSDIGQWLRVPSSMEQEPGLLLQRKAYVSAPRDNKAGVCKKRMIPRIAIMASASAGHRLSLLQHLRNLFTVRLAQALVLAPQTDFVTEVGEMTSRNQHSSEAL